jgi:phosphate transport system permease protein
MKKSEHYTYQPDPVSELRMRRMIVGQEILAKPLPLVRNLLGWCCGVIFYGLAVLAMIPLLSILWEILRKGLPSLSLGALISLPAPPGSADQINGFGHAIIGTIAVVGIASVVSIPLGILVGVYLAEFEGNREIDRWLSNTIRFSQRILASIPSIIVGVFAYGVMVLTTKKFSALAGSFALMVIMLPVVSLTTEEALRRVPNTWRLAAAALGGNKLQVISQVVFKSALNGITTGCILAIARAAGETAPLIFTALYSLSWPEGLMEPAAALPVLIFKYATSSVTEDKQLAWTAALILLVLVLSSNFLSRYGIRRSQNNS